MDEKPAIAGGTPAKQTAWGMGKRYGEEELQQLKEALDQGTLFYAQGKKVYQLEERFAAKYGAEFAVACTSGTSAIHTALIAAGISPGDEVIVPPITDMGSVVPILYQGAVPVFADLDPQSYALDPNSVEAAISENTRAVLAVHLWGNVCDLDALLALCSRHGLILIEDCAQAFGATYKGRPVGTIGAMGCFSFNEFKHISCGDGGLVLTNDARLAQRARLATDKGYNRDTNAPVRNPTFLANNYRMTELQGAVALAQLGKLDGIVARRRTWCEGLTAGLSGLEGIALPQPTPGCNPSWWFYMMRVRLDVLAPGADAVTITDEFARALNAEGINVGAHYIGKCIYEYPIFTEHSAFERGTHAYAKRSYGPGLCPIAEAILNDCIILVVKEWFTAADLEETLAGIRKVERWFRAGKTSMKALGR